MVKICLDPGHGGKDSGAPFGTRYEKNDVLRLALAVKPQLEAQGIDVVMTRDTDRNPTISERCKTANDAGCAYFISIHRDGSTIATAHGVSAWVHSRADAATVEKAQGILTRVLDVSKMRNRNVGKGTPQNFTDFGVNRETTMASVLLETGFITNAEDNAAFDAHFDAIAEAITRGLCAAVGKAYITPIDKPDTSALTAISGATAATAAQMRAYLAARNPAAPDYVDLYVAEGEAEGIRADVAFAQSCFETNHFAFGGDVKPHQNNFAGIGATGGGTAGNSFATPLEGIRAQVQHLKAYANTEPLRGVCVDPRFKYVPRGSAPYVEWLGVHENPNGAGWASGKGYGARVLSVLNGITATTEAPPAPTQPPAQGRTVTLAEAVQILISAGISDVIINK